MALMEGNELDPRNGMWINADLADYHVPVYADTHTMEVVWLEEPGPDRQSPWARKGSARWAWSAPPQRSPTPSSTPRASACAISRSRQTSSSEQKQRFSPANLSTRGQTMGKPLPYSSEVAIPLPTEEVVRIAMGESYQPGALNVTKMLAGTGDCFPAVRRAGQGTFRSRRHGCEAERGDHAARRHSAQCPLRVAAECEDGAQHGPGAGRD